MSVRSIFRQAVLAACICVVTLHPTQLRALAQQQGAKFYSFDERAKRAESIAKELAKCKRNKEDQRQLIEQVKAGMMSTVAASMDPNCSRAQDSLSKFSKNMNAINRAVNATDTGKFDYNNSLEFMKALRLQVVKNAALSHVDAAYRYPFMKKMTKVTTTADQFCGGQCTPAEKDELAKTVGAYRDGFNASKQKVYATADAARADLNQKLTEINQVHATVFKELDDRVKARNQADAAEKQRKLASDKFGLREMSKPRIDTMVDMGKVERDRNMAMYRFNEMERREFQNRYSAEYNARLQSGVGLLLYTSALTNEGEPIGKPGSLAVPATMPDPELSAKDQKKTGAKRVRSIEAAAGEILKDTEDLAAKTNEQYKKYSSISPLVRQMMTKSGASNVGVAGNNTAPLREMFKTNPVAAGQILVDHPEFAPLVCDLAVSVEKEDQSQRNKQTFFKVLAFGGMIIGGILLATGILGPAGLALMTVSSTVISTLTLVSVGMGVTGAALNIGNTIERRKELKTEVGNTRMGGNANTMDRQVSTALLKEFKTEQGSLSSNGELIFQGVMAVLPFKMNAIGGAIGRATKSFLGNSKIVNTFKNLVNAFKNNERAMLALDTLDYVCGAIGAGSCGDVTTGLSMLPSSRPHGQVAKIRGKNLDQLNSKEIGRLTREELGTLTQAEILGNKDLMARFVAVKNEDYVQKSLADLTITKTLATDKPANMVVVSEVNGKKQVQVFDSKGKPVSLKDLKFENGEVSFEDPHTKKMVTLTADKNFFAASSVVKRDVASWTDTEVNDWVGKQGFAETDKAKKSWNDFESTVRDRLPPAQADAIMRDAYHAHMSGKVGTISKDRAIAEFKQKLEAQGFTPVEAKALARDLADNRILGVFGRDGMAPGEYDKFKVQEVPDLKTEQAASGMDPKAFYEKRLTEFSDQYVKLQADWANVPLPIKKQMDAQMVIYRRMYGNQFPKNGDETAAKFLQDKGIKKRSGSGGDDRFVYEAPKVEIVSTHTTSGKTIEQSVQTMRDYDKKYNGNVMEADSKQIEKMAPSTEQGKVLDQRIAEQEGALKEIQDIEASFGKQFAAGDVPGAPDGVRQIAIRKESLKLSLEKLHKQKRDWDGRVKQLQSQIDGIGTGRDDFTPNDLKRQLETHQTTHKKDVRYIDKVRDEITTLQQTRDRFTEAEIPGLHGKKVDDRLASLKKFLKDSGEKPEIGGWSKAEIDAWVANKGIDPTGSKGKVDKKKAAAAWDRFAGALDARLKKGQLTQDQVDRTMREAYQAHMTGEPGTFTKNRAITEFKQRLMKRGFSNDEAHAMARDLGDNRILGNFDTPVEVASDVQRMLTNKQNRREVYEPRIQQATRDRSQLNVHSAYFDEQHERYSKEIKDGKDAIKERDNEYDPVIFDYARQGKLDLSQYTPAQQTEIQNIVTQYKANETKRLNFELNTARNDLKTAQQNADKTQTTAIKDYRGGNDAGTHQNLKDNDSWNAKVKERQQKVDQLEAQLKQVQEVEVPKLVEKQDAVDK